MKIEIECHGMELGSITATIMAATTITLAYNYKRVHIYIYIFSTDVHSNMMAPAMAMDSNKSTIYINICMHVHTKYFLMYFC